MSDDQDADRSAIIRVIEEECAAYFAKDFDRYQRCWAHEPYVRRFLWLPEMGMAIHVGWEEEGRALGDAFHRFPQPIANDVRRDWQVFLISGDLAWVVFDQYSDQGDDPCSVAGKQHEMRVLQKRNGAWLLVSVSNLKPRSEVARCPVLRVDETGKILWSNAQAQRLLTDHPALSVRAGRLRGRARSTDRGLQAAISWAAGALSGPPQQRFSHAEMATTGGALPIINETVLDRPQVLCWVAPVDGMVLVTFDDEETAEKRISTAAMIFRLSPAQLRLVRLLLSGRDLAQAAMEMSVSITTLRTQLARIFDKTGVHTQAALLRLMLSIAPPMG